MFEIVLGFRDHQSWCWFNSTEASIRWKEHKSKPSECPLSLVSWLVAWWKKLRMLRVEKKRGPLGGGWWGGDGGMMIWLRASFHFQSQERISLFFPKELTLHVTQDKVDQWNTFFLFLLLNFFLVWVGMFCNCFYKHFPSKDHIAAHVKEAKIDRKPWFSTHPIYPPNLLLDQLGAGLHHLPGQYNNTITWSTTYHCIIWNKEGPPPPPFLGSLGLFHPSLRCSDCQRGGGLSEGMEGVTL